MNIAIAIERYGPEAGGCERSTHQIAERLLARGHAITVLCNTLAAPPDPLPGATILEAKGPSTGRATGVLRFSRWARRRLAAGAFDLSFSVTAMVDATILEPRNGTVRGLAAHLAAVRQPLPRRLWQRVKNRVNAKRLALCHLETRHFQSPRIRRLVAISNTMAEQFRRFYNVPEERLTIIRNGATLSPLAPGPAREARSELRKRFGIPERSILFSFVGSDPRRKGLAGLLRALARARASAPEAHLLVTGTRDAAYQALARDLAVEEAVTWTGPRSDMAHLYAASDVAVMPSLYDPASKVVLEALRCGRPVIASSADGSSDWVREPGAQTGIVLEDPQDPDELAAALTRMLEPEVRARYAAATAPLARRLHMDRHVDELEQCFHRVLAETPRHTPAPRA